MKSASPLLSVQPEAVNMHFLSQSLSLFRSFGFNDAQK